MVDVGGVRTRIDSAEGWVKEAMVIGSEARQVALRQGLPIAPPRSRWKTERERKRERESERGLTPMIASRTL